MEELLLLAGYHSDTDSIRSTVTASLDVTKIRKRSGRKQQAPRRAAFDSGKASTTVSNHDILLTANQQVQGAVKDEALLPASASAAVGPVLHVNARTAAPAAREKKGKHDISGPCCHCNATSSPQWRKGPKGKPVLCNACGIRFLRNRTLTKVMPKKRRGASAVSGAMVAGDAAAAVVPKVKRSKTEKAPFTQDCGVMLASEEVLVTEDTLTITDDAAEEALSTEAAIAAQRSDIPLAAAAPMSADHIPFKKPAVPQPVAATGSSSSGYEVHEPSVRSCANGVQPLAAGSTHLLLGSNSWLHSSSPLSLALTMHQQRQLEASPRGNLTGSPVSDTSALSPGVRSSAGSLPSSPLLLGAAGTSDAVGQQQYQHQHNTSVWKHLLPAFPPAQQQMTAGCLTSQLLPKPAPLLLAGTTAPPATSALPGQTSPAIDILQLVQQISGVLGGVGPAVEFIKAMQSGGPAAAAALAAAAAAAVAF